MAQEIIGRDKEQQELQELYESGRPEFLVVHGRRRVGKTFLIREFFKGRFAFYHTGLSPAEREDSDKTILFQQLESFFSSLSRYGYRGKMPKDWIQAFDALIQILEQKDPNQRQVVFIDEMPWMDTPKSGFITAFEHFWNGWGAGQDNLMLIACGSSTSWIVDKIINNKGGLYNRITFEMTIRPFTLRECELFYKNRNIIMDRYDQLQAYMIFGGIPYYMSLLRKGLGLAQNVDALCFDPRGQLRMEFDRLFNSLFVNPEDNRKIIRALSKKRKGLLRSEISYETGIPTGGGLTNLLKSLQASDFIITYTTYKGSKRDTYFKLADHFCLFYLYFMDGQTNNHHFWSSNLTTPQLNAWRGFSFEAVCFSHIPQIKAALGISDVQTEVFPWISKQKKDGAQIDMLIVRKDHVINICEMKYSTDKFTITRTYDEELRHKLTLFEEETKNRMALHLTLITTYGLTNNEYAGHVQRLITMDDLFK